MRDVQTLASTLLPGLLLGGVTLLGSLSLASCDFEEGAPGARGFCGAATGQPLCAEAQVESADDACAKLVDCAAIPVSPPDGVDDPNSYFTYSTCIRRIEGYSDHRQFIALTCIEAATCAQLQFVNGPEAPRNRSENMPSCLEYGDQ
ncbi:MAG: hypothetical protein JKY56_02985 [Kofleriaceae bacterium]|nr:hypothetical protein [Kofleriaceae bacterium]